MNLNSNLLYITRQLSIWGGFLIQMTNKQLSQHQVCLIYTVLHLLLALLLCNWWSCSYSSFFYMYWFPFHAYGVYTGNNDDALYHNNDKLPLFKSYQSDLYYSVLFYTFPYLVRRTQKCATSWQLLSSRSI